MWTYSQRSGLLTHNGIDVATGYSGHGEGLNNPAMQDQRMQGPLPQGIYTIGFAQFNPQLGPVSMRLTPAANNQMFGRAGFFIHGDNSKHDHSASEGCMIFDRTTRTLIAGAALAGDDTLHVTE